MAHKVVNTGKLLQLINAAKRQQFSRRLNQFDLGKIDPKGNHLLCNRMVHGDGQCVRCEAYVKILDSAEPETGLLDVSFEDWNKLVVYKEVVALAAEKINDAP